MKKTRKIFAMLVLVFVPLAVGSTEGFASSPSWAPDSLCEKQLTNEETKTVFKKKKQHWVAKAYKSDHPEVQFYYPLKWPTKTSDLAFSASSLEGILNSLQSFGLAPRSALESKENHDPLNGVLYFGYNICDDGARLAHNLLKANGIRSRVLYMNGHVALDVFWKGAWVYMDPYHGFFLQNGDGTLASSSVVTEASEEREFIAVCNGGKKVKTKRSDLSLIGKGAFGEEFASSVSGYQSTAFPMLTGDQIEVFPSLEKDFQPYKYSEHTHELTHLFFSQLSFTRHLATTQLFSEVQAPLVSTYNDVTVDHNNQAFTLKGTSASVAFRFALPCPIVGVDFQYSKLSKKGKGKVIYQLKDTGGKEVITLQKGVFENAGNTSVRLPIDTLRKGPYGSTTRTIDFKIVHQSTEISDSVKIVSPVAKVHCQITPDAFELF